MHDQLSYFEWNSQAEPEPEETAGFSPRGPLGIRVIAQLGPRGLDGQGSIMCLEAKAQFLASWEKCRTGGW
jgi:hypothetical protein